MQETIFISLPVKDLQALIIDCVNSCLQKNADSNSPQSNTDQLLTIQLAAELLILSVPTIYGLVSRGEIPHSKKGKRLYFSQQELLDWVQSGRKKTNSEIAAEAECPNNKKHR